MTVLSNYVPHFRCLEKNDSCICLKVINCAGKKPQRHVKYDVDMSKPNREIESTVLNAVFVNNCRCTKMIIDVMFWAGSK